MINGLYLILGLKFVDRDSLFLSPAGCTEMFKLADANAFVFPSYQKMGNQHELILHRNFFFLFVFLTNLLFQTKSY